MGCCAVCHHVAIRATYHTTLKATPTQLVFGRDAIFNIKFNADWNAIKQRKQQVINKNNSKENSKRIPHEYKVDDQVLYREIPKSKFGQAPYKGPYKVVQVNNNGTVHLRMGPVIERINI